MGHAKYIGTLTQVVFYVQNPSVSFILKNGYNLALPRIDMGLILCKISLHVQTFYLTPNQFNIILFFGPWKPRKKVHEFYLEKSMGTLIFSVNAGSNWVKTLAMFIQTCCMHHWLPLMRNSIEALCLPRSKPPPHFFLAEIFNVHGYFGKKKLSRIETALDEDHASLASSVYLYLSQNWCRREKINNN